jgi:hypothetical protein
MQGKRLAARGAVWCAVFVGSNVIMSSGGALSTCRSLACNIQALLADCMTCRGLLVFIQVVRMRCRHSHVGGGGFVCLIVAPAVRSQALSAHAEAGPALFAG